MKRIAWLGLWGLILLVGCSAEQQAETVLSGGTSFFNRTRMDLTGTAEQLKQQEQISNHHRVRGDDGTAIDVWTIRNRTENPSRGTVMLLHGLGESKADYLATGKILADRGFDVVLPDLRAHGRSEGKYITYGVKEARDVAAVMQAACKADGLAARPQYLCGTTLGAVTAIMYAADESDVAGMVCLAPWTDAVVMGRRRLAAADPTSFSMNDEKYREVLDLAGEMADFDPQHASALAAAPNITFPVYIIHGLFDWAVPLDDSRKIHDALGGRKELKVVSPGPEQLAIGTSWDHWLADRVERVAKGDLRDSASEQSPDTEKPTDAGQEDADEPETVSPEESDSEADRP